MVGEVSRFGKMPELVCAHRCGMKTPNYLKPFPPLTVIIMEWSLLIGKKLLLTAHICPFHRLNVAELHNFKFDYVTYF